MKILAYVHGYLPNLNAGAETMLHQVLLDLKSRGHEVAVITYNPGATEYDGIQIYEATNGKSKNEINLFEWCDFVFTQLFNTREAVELGKKYNKKIVHFVHDDYISFLQKCDTFDKNRVMFLEDADLVVANSEWIKKTIYDGFPSIIVNPPTKPDVYRINSKKIFVTLINLCAAKGGEIFWELAKSMPNVSFLGVKGGWGDQIVKDNLPNVRILENTTNIQKAYALTKILIIPSSYESWGRVGIEASCSGIPVIASPTPGLKESLGNSAIFVDLQNIEEWRKAIEYLSNKKNYYVHSGLAQERARYLSKEFDNQINALENKLLEML